MKLNFSGDIAGLENGIGIFSKLYDFEVSKSGIHVEVEAAEERSISICRRSDRAFIKYHEKVHFFRALSLFLQYAREDGDFEITEEPQFITNGVMIDVSQGNSVLTLDSIKRILALMASMGLNMFMIYMEDNYVVEGEPYFGYMRGRYTRQELKECDDFACDLGIEMIPCIQTLAHLIDALKWDCYSDMKDDDDTLLVGDSRVYELIEKFIRAASEPFRSRRIHIGMDEAWKLGQGNYLLKNGYRSKFDIMTEHLERVLEITEKYGLEPMIWSDMYFRASSSTGGYYDKDSVIPESVRDRVPGGVKLVYWDYYHRDGDFYAEWIRRHRDFGREPVFAGGIWSWNGYAVDYEMTFDTTNAALAVCKKEKVREVFATIWGDGGTESNIYSNLLGLQLFAEHGYAPELDPAKLRERFRFCTGCNMDDFMEISFLDRLPGAAMPGNNSCNPCKYLMWQDPMMGLFDRDLEDFRLKEHYSRLEEKMKAAAQRNGDFGFVFEFLSRLCSVLALKSELGRMLVKQCNRDNTSELELLASFTIPELSQRVEDLRKLHRELWHRINLPFGWEVLDIRYGGLLARLDSSRARIEDYLEGRLSKLEELEEGRLYFTGVPGPVMCLPYSRMPSASRLSYATGF